MAIVPMSDDEILEIEQDVLDALQEYGVQVKYVSFKQSAFYDSLYDESIGEREYNEGDYKTVYARVDIDPDEETLEMFGSKKDNVKIIFMVATKDVRDNEIVVDNKDKIVYNEVGYEIIAIKKKAQLVNTLVLSYIGCKKMGKDTV